MKFIVWKRGGSSNSLLDYDIVYYNNYIIAAVSLHLPMILAKARQECKDFYEVLDEYLQLIREIHLMTREYLGNMRASTNPIAYCQGGFYQGNLNPNDKIKPLLKYATASFGITALNELNRLYNGKSIREDGEFPLQVMEHINKRLKEFTKEDGMLYAVYGTPAESLCFSGDTEVQTYEGNKQIKDLKVGDLVYSFNEEKHKVELNRVVRSMKTHERAKVLKVTFNTGQEVLCTPNHPFGIRRVSVDESTHQFMDREYIEWVRADKLEIGMRVKSNYLHLNYFGRPECSICYDGRRQLIHDIHAEYFFGPKPEGYIVHHKDEDITNNFIDNLEYMTDHDHKIHHMKDTIGKYCYTSDNQRGENNSFYGKHHSDKTKMMLRNKKKGRAVCQYDLNGKLIKRYECMDDTEQDGFTRHLVKLACCGKNALKTMFMYFGHIYHDFLWYYEGDIVNPVSHLALEENHTVEKIEWYDEEIPTYNIEVENNHNFFIGGNDGILVHNCGTQVKQFRSKYGIVENVSDREYVSNSFHCHVSEDMSGIEKQDKEFRFWELFKGGRIQYVKYDINYNREAVVTYVRRAMRMGLYEGINFTLCYCDHCGHSFVGGETCPKCGSTEQTRIERMNGYLSFSRVHGDTRLNDAKMAEIADRKSM